MRRSKRVETPNQKIKKIMPIYRYYLRLAHPLPKLKYLAKEVLITELFVNRLRRQTTRPIVVIGIERTGVPYTWSITPDNKRVFLDSLVYSSTKIHTTVFAQKTNLLRKIGEYRKELRDPLFVFVDASSSARMPSSFVGSPELNGPYKLRKDCMETVLNQNNLKTKVVGYDWSMKDSSKYLPKDIALEKLNAILFNPSKERKIKYKFEGEKIEYSSAIHDDKCSLMDSLEFKETVLDIVKYYKRNL